MNKGKLKLPIKTYLLYLIIVAVLITGASFARYTVSVDGKDSISVAKPILSWDLLDGEEEPTPIPLNLGGMIPGDNQKYQLEVTNKNGGKTSDVAIDFIIVITITDNIPLTVTLKENKEGGTTFTQDADKKIITPNPYTFNVGSAQIIKFELEVDWNSAYNDPSYAGKTDTITIEVSWSQQI